MSKFRNDTGGVLRVNDLMRDAGPGEEFDWPDHDLEVHGLIPGCTLLDAPTDEAGDSDPSAAADSGTDPGPADDSTDPEDKQPARKRGPATKDKEASA